MTKLLLYLNPSGNFLDGLLPKGSMPVYPFYTTVSRLKYKPDSFDCKLYSKPLVDIVALPNHRLSFANCCDQRAVELLQLSGNIYVMWSGGIDSTALLVAILKNWPGTELDRVTVLCDNHSIKENRNFFKIVVNNFKILPSTNNLEQYCKLGYVITGELNDQLFGSDVVGTCVEAFGDTAIQSEWKVVAPKIFELLSPQYGAKCYDNYKNIVSESPFELKTTHDFFWFLNFTQKWQNVQLRTLMVTTWTDTKTYFPKLIAFFDTEYFQVWSIHNQDKKIKHTWLSYKYIAKEYIIEYTKDSSFINKPKIPSLPNLFIGTQFHWSIDEDWNYLTKDETMLRLLKD
jgi:hypothetical protein